MTQGLLLLNKPKGITSFSAVARIKRIAGEKRVGHTGTLDPMATGVLPIFIGRATALSSYLLDADKCYIATVLFGTVTDTGDITGCVLKQSSADITEEQIDEAITHFIGEITQVPPMHSAIKKDGVPLYKLARRGEKIDVPARQVTINSITKVSQLNGGSIQLAVSCSKGTYIRSLCQDIGEYLGCGATLTDLCRTATSGFELSQCVDLEKLNEENITDYLLDEEKAVESLRTVRVSYKQAIRFSNGGQLDLERLKFTPDADGENVRVKYGDTFLGIGSVNIEKQHIGIRCIINPITESRRTAVCLGTFDGVHLGHKKVIEDAVGSGYTPVAVTFDMPPKSYFGKDAGLLKLRAEKDELLTSLGIKKTVYLDFNEVCDYSPEQFLEFLKKTYNCAYISCGFNYRFGKDGAGDIELLRKFCEENGITLSVSEPIMDGDEVVSSTLLRRKLSLGEVGTVNRMCAAPFGFSGEIIHGDARGRTLGFPTVNQLYPETLAPLRHGVYRTEITVDSEKYAGITNVGVRPTFANDFVSCETYILDFSSDIYGKSADIRFKEFIREEKKFSSVDELTSQIEKDVEYIKKNSR